jgi:hypothetical protein
MDDNEKKQEIMEKNLGLVGKLKQFIDGSQYQSEGNNSSTKAKSEENNATEKKLNNLDQNEKEKGVELFDECIEDKEDINSIKEEQLKIGGEPENKNSEINTPNNDINNYEAPIIINFTQVFPINSETKEKENINKNNNINNSGIPNQNITPQIKLLEKGIIQEENSVINLGDLLNNTKGNSATYMEFDNIRDISLKGDNNINEEDPNFLNNIANIEINNGISTPNYLLGNFDSFPTNNS